MNESMDENVTANLSLLIASLDYCSMSSEEIEEIFSIDKIDLAFSPRNAEKRIKMFIEEEKEMKSKISNLEEKINQNEENCNQRIKNLEDNYNKKISDLENKINQNEETYNKKIKNIEDILKDSIEIKIAQLEKSNEKIIKSTLPNDKNVKSFSPKNSNDFDGIFDFLTKKTGSNIHNSKIIEITSNSALNGYHPKFLLETCTSYVTLAGEKYAWVCFDFINMKIEITEYKIDASGSCPIKNWVLEVSNDKSNWKTIDTHSNDEIFKGSIKIQTFKVQKNDFSRYCRIRHTGEFCDYSSGCHMQIYRIEFYGKLEIHE